MKSTFSVAVLSALLLLTTPLVFAEQDILILDPGGGHWREENGIAVAGDAGVYRSDLLKVPANMERIICYMDHNLTPPQVKPIAKFRYSIDRGAGRVDMVEVIDKSGSTSGVKIRWNGHRTDKKCDYADPEDCTFSGIPPELFGDFIGGAVEARVGSSWVVVTSEIQIQYTSSSTPTCTAF